MAKSVTVKMIISSDAPGMEESNADDMIETIFSDAMDGDQGCLDWLDENVSTFSVMEIKDE